jgi:N-acetylglutamate synthase-like GNAT family acetyltransferase
MDLLVPSKSAPAMLPDRVDIREADEADNEGLLSLTQITPMDGAISLRIDREPDFFALLRLRGKSKVFVAVRGRQIIGCISVALRTAYISGIPETIAYIRDMKVHPSFTGTRVAARLIKALEADMRIAGIDTGFCVTADGNHRVMPLLEGRLGMPRWVPLGRFLVSGLVPSPFKRYTKRYLIDAAEPADLPAIATLLDRFHRSRQFAPQLQEDEMAEILSTRLEEPFRRTFVARRAQRAVATLTICDTGAVKRNVLLNASALQKGALALLRVAAAPFPSFHVPRMGQALRLLSVRYAACEDEDHAALEALIALARAEAFRHRFTFLMFGLHERDPLRNLVRRIPRFTFSSLALATSLGNPGGLEKRVEGIPFEDYALV